jgi:hypothetical protein
MALGGNVCACGVHRYVEVYANCDIEDVSDFGGEFETERVHQPIVIGQSVLRREMHPSATASGCNTKGNIPTTRVFDFAENARQL